LEDFRVAGDSKLSEDSELVDVWAGLGSGHGSHMELGLSISRACTSLDFSVRSLGCCRTCRLPRRLGGKGPFHPFKEIGSADSVGVRSMEGLRRAHCINCTLAFSRRANVLGLSVNEVVGVDCAIASFSVRRELT